MLFVLKGSWKKGKKGSLGVYIKSGYAYDARLKTMRNKMSKSQ